MEAVFSLLPLAIVALIVWAIVAAVRGRDDDDEPADPGIGTVRRLFIYAVSLVALVLAGWGISVLLGGLIDAIGPGRFILGREDTGLALGLALTVVGAPVWGLFWYLGQRSLRDHPVEQRSLARRLYFAAVRGTALVILLVNGVRALQWLLGIESFEGDAWGWLLTWGAIWLFHERWAAVETAPTARTRQLDRLYLYFGSVVGLAMLASAAAIVLHESLRAAYEELFFTRVIGGGLRSDDLREGLALALPAAAVLRWHWLRRAIDDAGTTLWLTYVLLIGVLSGAVAAIAGAGAVVWAVIAWLVDATDNSAANHFDLLPGAITSVALGLAVAGYHRLVQVERSPDGAARTEPERIYRYLLAAAGLVTLAVGLVALFGIGVDAVTRESSFVRDSDWWRNPFAVGATSLVVGLPLWAWHWLKIQRAVAGSAVAERAALSRRSFLFTIGGVGVLTAVVNLVIVLFQLFEGVL